jgi:hypothetical protein
MNVFTNVIQGPARVLINDVGVNVFLSSPICSFIQSIFYNDKVSDMIFDVFST